MFQYAFGHLIQDTMVYVDSLESYSFSHIYRQGNSVADALAKKGFFFYCLDRVCSSLYLYYFFWLTSLFLISKIYKHDSQKIKNIYILFNLTIFFSLTII